MIKQDYEMRVAIYIRVSTYEQTLGFSLSEQESRLRAFCVAKGWEVSEVYCDGGFSGSNLERPALKKLMDEMNSGKYNLVLVYKLDRLSRSQKDTLYLIEDVFNKNSIEFVSMQENFDTSTSMGRAMVGIISVFAQLEREQIKERMGVGREGRAKKGLWHGSTFTPFGYKYINKELVVDEFESVLVQEIFNRYIQGESASKISEDMEKRYPQYKSFGAANSITEMLKRKTYLGIINHNKDEYEGQHQAIITREVFEEAQQMLESKEKYNRHKVNSEHLLVGLIYCKKCGARFGYAPKITQRKKPNGEYVKYSYPKYECYSRWGISKQMMIDPNCKNKIWDAPVLEQLIVDEINKLKFDDGFKKEVATIKIDNKQVAKNKIKDIDAQISKLVDLYTIEDINISLIQNKVKVLNEQRQEILNKMMNEDAQQEKIKKFKKNLNLVSVIFKNDNMVEQRQLIQSLIEKIEIDDDNVFIHWNF